MSVVQTAIPYVSVAAQHRPLRAELLTAIGEVLDEGQFILGEQVKEFEARFAELCGVRHAVAVNSGTDALILGLKAAGIGSGDEVITVPNSFVSSPSCLRLVGATPVFVDVRDDYNIDVSRVEDAITERTRAILPVHLTGRPCDMDALVGLARAYNLALVEDCAQAVLASYRGRRVGSFGAAGAFSLHPLKTLNACGDGGVVTTDDDEKAERLRLLRNIGLRTRDDCVVWSSNSRLDTMQAAILLVKLRYLEAWTARRRENARRYIDGLSDLAEHIETPRETPEACAVYHTFVVQADRRDELRAFLAEHGIGSAVHYPTPIHLATAGRELGYAPGDFPVAERLAGRILSLPIYPELGATEIDYVCYAIRSFYARS